MLSGLYVRRLVKIFFLLVLVVLSRSIFINPFWARDLSFSPWSYPVLRVQLSISSTPVEVISYPGHLPLHFQVGFAHDFVLCFVFCCFKPSGWIGLGFPWEGKVLCLFMVFLRWNFLYLECSLLICEHFSFWSVSFFHPAFVQPWVHHLHLFGRLGHGADECFVVCTALLFLALFSTLG